MEMGQLSAGSLFLRWGDLPFDTFCHVLEFCTWPERLANFCLSTFYRRLLDQDPTWKHLCSLLAQDFIHVPTTLTQPSWKHTFQQLWAVRRAWTHSVEDTKTFTLNVVVRFRPLLVAQRSYQPLLETKEDEDSNNDSDDDSTAVLPLHQKLKIIQSQRHCSASEAKRVLWGSERASFDPFVHSRAKFSYSSIFRGGECDGQCEGKCNQQECKWQQQQQEQQEQKEEEEEEEKKDADDVKNAEGGKRGGGVYGARVIATHPRSVVMCAPGVGIREFGFDAVLHQRTTQAQFYTSSKAADFVTRFLNGQKVCILCYGQTGSGKTHTMYGPNSSTASKLSSDNADAGFVTRVLKDVVDGLATRRRAGARSELFLSYVEVYGEAVNNLLKGGEAIGNWRGVATRTVLQGGAAVEVESQAHLESLLMAGENAKRWAETAMNARSSRSHVLLLLTMKQHLPGREEVVSSSLCLADLGGSEQIKKSKAKGQQLAEAVNINMGLLALKNVISGLQLRRQHIPYHSSNLTMLLSEALGGDARTLVVVTASLRSEHGVETLQSLRFGEQCAGVQNTANTGVSNVQAILQQLDKDIAECEEYIKKHQRWENIEVVRHDVVDDRSVGKERQLKTVIVGAEQQQAELKVLLERRRLLLQ
eukprot:CAMPEP_0175136002 /NCGR_PEP_ID=MMETSP0087-20121206/9038_1 /TAXON_ID=136419 /ORGANISM="Unknown Unknown, Strain D1" /LENGTH=645 /DNA_ID=CAMNT_0016418719 /DNA_START=30 /DNA_END=1967 /DNA_ORIENTATION=-